MSEEEQIFSLEVQLRTVLIYFYETKSCILFIARFQSEFQWFRRGLKNGSSLLSLSTKK